jgi:phosphatidate phosphatase APP1
MDGMVQTQAFTEGAFKQGLRHGLRKFAQLRRHYKRKWGLLAPLRIAVYGGYGSPTHVTVRGRVLEERLGAAPTPSDRGLMNLKRAWGQLESDEVPGVGVLVSAAGRVAHAVSDDEGYFVARLELPGVEPGWLAVEAEIVEAPYGFSERVIAQGAVLLPAPGARFGVISDIDDTILRTHVRNKAKMVLVTLLGNALTRLSFDGTTELYQGLLAGGGNAPFFYVSRSMWNIFPLLEHFIDHQKLPRGPLLLRDVSLLSDRRALPHKEQAIGEILATYPELPFVLIGDTAQRDLDIYLAAARANPGRVLTILIRNVSSQKRAERLRRLASEAAPGCNALVFDDSRQAIEHCVTLGLWSPPQLVAAAIEAAQ